MMDTLLELDLRCVDALFAEYQPDAVCLWEDMACRHGSLLAPALVRAFLLPRCRALVRRLRERGVPYVLLDSDGRIDELIPLWLEAGVDGVVPMEAQSGMDVALYRERYPRLLMLGGVDKRALAAGPAAIDVEMAKVRWAIARGGYIPFFDHGLPHDVSWANFCHFVARLRELDA
jgi:uroporphyrinogen decarboxylase